MILIPLNEIDARLDHGARWIPGWGDWESTEGATCLHGAIRHCQLVPGDAYLIQQVGSQFGFGIDDNDRSKSWEEVRAQVPPVVTDQMLAETFGPQWEPIVALVRRAAVLTVDELSKLAATRTAARDAAGAATWDAAKASTRTAAWDAAWAAVWGAAMDGAGTAATDAAWGLVVRDLIGQHGLTQAHYDRLTAPWTTVIGPAHPDDLRR